MLRYVVSCCNKNINESRRLQLRKTLGVTPIYTQKKKKGNLTNSILLVLANATQIYIYMYVSYSS